MRQIGILTATLALGLIVPANALAGGYYIGDVGTRGMARGGALIAAPNDLLALHYNPAGLALIKGGFHLEADLNLVEFNHEFKRSCPCTGPDTLDAATLDRELKGKFIGRTAKEINGIQDIPYVALAYGFDWNHLTVGLAVYGPQGARRYQHKVEGEKASNQPQRYSSLNVEVEEIYYTLGVAASPIKGLRIGFGAQLFQFATKQELTLWANSSYITTPEDPDWDIPTTLNFNSTLLPNWNLGLSYEVIDGLSVGASVLGKRSVRADGTSSIELPATAAAIASIEGNKLELEINLPPIWRFGVQYAKPKIFSVEAAWVLEAWSVYDKARIRSKDVNIILNMMPAKLATIDIPYEFEDTWSIRVGGEFDMFAPYVTLGAGYFYEPSAVAPQLKDVSSPDMDKHGISGGLSTKWFGTTLSVAAQYIKLADLTVTDSKKALVGPLPEPGGSQELLTTVANGDYSGDYFIVSASLSAVFDEVLGNF
jgi:long-subunit fatty acid transport protein